MDPSDERTLIKRAQRGDIAAFQALVRPHLPRVRRLAYAFCQNWTDADDLSQDALIKAYRSLPTFRGEAGLSTWLYTVTRSTFLDWLRGRAAKTRSLEDPLSDRPAPLAEAQDDLLEGKKQAEQLWAAIRRLDPRFRVPLVLFEIEGMAYEDIAAIEGIPVGTVRSRLARARTRLRELLGAAEVPVMIEGTSEVATSSNTTTRADP